MKIKLIPILLILTAFLISVDAKYVQTSKVKYKQDYSWSKYYTVEVTYMTGYELNKATSSYNYSSYSKYAIVFWDKDEASVIKLSSYLSCGGNEFTQNCIANRTLNLEGEDQNGRLWEVCTKNNCY